ncbi:Sorting nexin-12 [Psilocybe cubensis]|uniref:PhoX domain-containing protein n=2 Tax=Psilocybe cubensis TaxID=181762 RepID=A0A8H8CR26_PSICU|nr:Sorting nexin-12 [Psilocybe cubensis]KAH9486274.1 Sorting nexin-12 [Psilocybe cubensis]
MPQNLLSTGIVVFVGILAVVLPIISRIVSSPFILLLISPFLLSALAIVYLLLNVYLGWYLDTRRTHSHNHLHKAARPFAFSTPAAWEAVLTRSQWSQNTPKTLSPLYPDSLEVSDALNDIVSKVIRDFVSSWYKDLSTSPAFPIAVSSVIHASLEQINRRASHIDLSALVVKRILPKVTAHIDQFRQSEVALRGAGLERSLTQSEELDLLLASRYASKGIKLHPAVENLSTTFTRQTEEMHIRQLVDRALPYILPPKERSSKGLRIVVREIVTCSVLFPVMEMVSDPDFWNRTIDQVAGAAIHQQQLISKVRNVLEAQLPRQRSRITTSTPAASASGYTERVTIRTNPKQFESFLRSISNCSSLLDARRLKNDIVGEIRRTRVLLANHEKDDWIDGEKTEDVVAFLDRLYTAKRKVEERIVVLGGEDSSRQNTIQDDGTKSSVTLRDILRNPNSLSYFMEFMDRRHRSLPVQFWLTVESFKNPLETVDSDTSGEEEEIIQDPSTSTTVKEDISMINDLYFLDGKTQAGLGSISKKHVDIIRDFVSDPDPSVQSQRRVRRSVLLSQRQVERDMEQDFEDFERSELWFRAIGDSAFLSNKSEPDPFAKAKDSPSDTPRGDRSPAIPSAQIKHYTISQATHTRESPPFGMQRTISSTSNRSGQSKVSSTHTPSNIEVLMSPVAESSNEPSRAPLFDDPEDEMQRAEEKRMEAIHAALTDIMALEQENSERPSLAERNSEPLFKSVRKSDRPKRPSILNNAPPEPEEEPEDVEHDGLDETGSFQLAAPGDLQLSYEISRLGENIANLEAQNAMLQTLIKKAELTGDTQELRLLTKSKASMTRELRELHFQKQQYEQQESANRLISDRTRVSIVNSTVAEEDGKSVVRYLVEVQQLGLDGSFASGWVVARRYNEFHNMHNKLKERYILVKNLDFPGKRLVTSLSGSFLDTRRVALEKYLQSVIAIPVVCESHELRAFLSRDSPFMTAAVPLQEQTSKSSAHFSGTDLVRNVYRSVAESIDDMFFGPSMLDVMIQRLTRQAAEFTGIVGSGINDEDLVAQALNASGKAASEATLLKLTGDLKPLEGETSTSTFSAPICDLILAVFELHKKNNWLRRQAIVIILQQVLGGTIERKIRETVKGLLSEARLMSYINLLRDSLWPGGRLRAWGPPRTTEEKIRTRDDANRKLSSLVPDLAANMIGRTNARRGARRIFAVLQNRRLNQHIAYTIMDELFAALFPEVAQQHP